MNICFDLALLDSGSKNRAIVFARRESDVVLERITLGSALHDLRVFRERIGRALVGSAERPQVKELTAFGNGLFNVCFRGNLAHLYRNNPDADVRIHLLTNQPDLMALPWEYIQEPRTPSGPKRTRSLVRVVPTLGRTTQAPKSLNSTIKILFAVASPATRPFSWERERDAIQEVLLAGAARANAESLISLDIVRGESAPALNKALSVDKYDIFHFSGHGEIVDGVGHVILNNGSKLSAELLASMLQGRQIRLAVFSSCDTAAGRFDLDFGVIAKTLVENGIPAVVAHQFPIPDQAVADFMGALYHELFNSGDIDLAVTSGRQALQLIQLAGQQAPLEWGVPTLYRHIGGAQVFTR